MTYYGVATWTEFTIVDGHHATARIELPMATVVDSLVVNDWFKAKARSQPPATVSDSLEARRSSDLEGGDHAQDFTLENMSDSLKPRESHHWTDADPGEEDDQLYEMFCQSGQFWHEAGEYVSKGRLYYRYRWGHGHKIEGVRHIPGGSLYRGGLVRSRAEAVERAVYVDHRPHHEIVAMIDQWRASRCAVRRGG